MSPDFATFFYIYQYDFVVGLLQGFMINVHESGNNSPGAGTFSTDLTKVPAVQGFYLGFAYGKINIPAIVLLIICHIKYDQNL